MAAPPHPRANLVLGSAPDLRRSQIGTYERVMREYGDVVRLVVGPPGVRFDLYCVFHPDGVKAVLAGSRGGSSKGNRTPTLEDAPALERTVMAIKEATRLYPPAYALGRLSDTENEIGGYSIPPGANVVVSQFAMLEAVIALAVLLQRFGIRSEQQGVPLDTQGITLRPKGAVAIEVAAP